MLEEWVHRLEERDLLFHVLASYEMRKISADYCPPVHLQQLKKALVQREEAKRVAQILEKFPARKILHEETGGCVARHPPADLTRKPWPSACNSAEDLMRLRRDRRNYQQVAAWMERINLFHSNAPASFRAPTRAFTNSCILRKTVPTDDPVINHVVIKADVRGSTSMTKNLLSRGHESRVAFQHGPARAREADARGYGAAKVFIEGDAIILAIYETESTRATRRAVARACVLAREILAVTRAYNVRAKSGDLPPLELGVGVAFQDSAPSLWEDADSKIMISRALNLSDRLRAARKWPSACSSPTRRPSMCSSCNRLWMTLRTMRGEELLVRYNLNGIVLNEEGFQKLSAEISLAPMGGNFPLPWGKERVQLYFGEVPLGESLEPIVVRKGFVRQLLPGAKIGDAGQPRLLRSLHRHQASRPGLQETRRRFVPRADRFCLLALCHVYLRRRNGAQEEAELKVATEARRRARLGAGRPRPSALFPTSATKPPKHKKTLLGFIAGRNSFQICVGPC